MRFSVFVGLVLTGERERVISFLWCAGSLLLQTYQFVEERQITITEFNAQGGPTVLCLTFLLMLLMWWHVIGCIVSQRDLGFIHKKVLVFFFLK